MKTHFAEEFDDATQANETAEEHVWHAHRLAPSSTFGNVGAIILLAVAFLALVKLSTPSNPSLVGAVGMLADQHLVPELGDERER